MHFFRLKNFKISSEKYIQIPELKLGKLLTFVLIDHVRKYLARSGHADTLSVPQLINPTLLSQKSLPEGTVSCTSRHGPQ